MKQRIAVLFGGPSNEHEVSVSTGSVVIRALDREQYEVIPVYIGKDGLWQFTDDSGERAPQLPPTTDALTQEAGVHELFARSIDVAFIALHGAFGEDGTIQAILEQVGMPYTGSSSEVCALAFDKPRTLQRVASQGIPIPRQTIVTKDEWLQHRDAVLQTVQAIELPFVTKPAAGGSSIGITIVRHLDQLTTGIELALNHNDRVLCEQYIAGTELTCGAIDQGQSVTTQALVPTEIRPNHAEFFDYDAKYSPGASTEITPPNIAPNIIEELKRRAVLIHNLLGCSGMSRSDFILATDGTLYFLELNTIPGMTPTSLLPQGAQAIGLTFPQLLDQIIAAAAQRSTQSI